MNAESDLYFAAENLSATNEKFGQTSAHLDEANAALNEAQANVSNIQNDLKSAKSIGDEKLISVIEAKLNEAKEKLQAAGEEKAQAQKEFDEAQDAVKAAEEELEQAKNKRFETDTAARNAQKEYKEAAGAKVETEANLREKEAELAKAKGGTPSESPTGAQQEDDTYPTAEQVHDEKYFSGDGLGHASYNITNADGSTSHYSYSDLDGNGKFNLSEWTDSADGTESDSKFYDEDGNIKSVSYEKKNSDGSWFYHSFSDWDGDGKYSHAKGTVNADGVNTQHKSYDEYGNLAYEKTETINENGDKKNHVVHYDPEGRVTDIETVATETVNENGDKITHYVHYDSEGNIIDERITGTKPDGIHYYEKNGMVEENS